MSVWAELANRFRYLIRRTRFDEDLDQEIHFHVEARAAELEAAGFSPSEALTQARREFGSTLRMRESTREAWQFRWFENLCADLRCGLRMLARSPVFAVVAVLTLGLSIGANTAVFTVVHAMLLRALPFPDPGQLVQIYAGLGTSDLKNAGMSIFELEDLRDRSGIFSRVSPVSPENGDLSGLDRPERIEELVVSVDYFSLLGATPALGRAFEPKDAVPGFSEAAVISDNLWRRRFGADPHVIGRQLRLDNDLYTVVGVMPPDFHHPGRILQSDVDIWNAAGWVGAPFPTPRRDVRNIREAIGRLRPGMTVRRAQAQLDAFAMNLRREYPESYPANARWSPRIVPLQDAVVVAIRPVLAVLSVSVALVLLITCVNVANLLLGRAWLRRTEIAVRCAIGAGRGRLMAQLVTESLLLATFAGAAGVATSFLLLRSFVLLASPNIPRLSETPMNGTVLCFALLLSLLTGLLFGLIPAFHVTRANLSEDLKEGGRGPTLDTGHNRLRRLLVVSEFALSLMLMAGAGLLFRTFFRLLDTNPGFNPHNLVTARTWLPAPNDPDLAPYAQLGKRSVFIRDVLERAKYLPGVARATIATNVPLGPGRDIASFAIEGRPTESEERPSAEFTAVSLDYFRAMETPLVRGRWFTASDDEHGEPVAIVDEDLARRFWPGEDVLGKRLKPEENGRMLRGSGWLKIVGVVGNMKTQALDIPAAPHIYLPIFQHSDFGLAVLLRTKLDPNSLKDVASRLFQSVDANLPVFAVRTMDEVIGTALAERRFAAELVGVFAVVALILAAVGIYGVMAYIVGQRTHEFGLRMALGAQSGDVFRLVLTEGLSLALLGLVAGSAGALALSRLMRASLLFGIKSYDPPTFSTVVLLLIGIAFLACWIPARRATRVDPMVALRCE
jgi:putative ABC transport system permease protein